MVIEIQQLSCNQYFAQIDQKNLDLRSAWLGRPVTVDALSHFAT